MIGSRLREKRKKLGLSMNAVAKAADLDQRFVSRVEKAEQIPSLLSLKRICKELSMTFEELFRGF